MCLCCFAAKDWKCESFYFHLDPRPWLLRVSPYAVRSCKLSCQWRTKQGGREWDKKKRGGGGGIWIGQWSECKKESGGRSRIKGERVDKNLSSLHSIIQNAHWQASYLPSRLLTFFNLLIAVIHHSIIYQPFFFSLQPLKWAGVGVCACGGGGEFF